ncbi:MAG: TonB-dependent receptor, plug [Alphaproteobacteria bacterium]|nr:MAG: TonB-dependent receptor, plug [Alphaproteobacteria bacterium]
MLRGPQGTLYGRNATAGAVLIQSAEPTDSFSARASVTVATDEEYRANGAVSGPLNANGTLLGRLAVGHSERGGWGTNAVRGVEVNSGEDGQVRGFLRFQPAESLKIDLIADTSYSKIFPGTINISDVSNFRDQTTNPAGTNVVTPYVPRANLQTLIDNNSYALNFPTFTTIHGQNYTGRINWDVGSVTVTAISNYRKWHLIGSQDSDGVAVDPPTPAFVTGSVTNIGNNANGNTRDEQFSQEIRLASNNDGPFSWIVGAFYFHEENSATPITINNLLAGPGGAGTLVTFVTSQDATSYAAFADVSYNFTDRLKLSVGARYSQEEKDFLNSQLVQTINQFDPPGPTFFAAGATLAAPPNLALHRKDTDFSPRVVLDYKVNEDTLVYASYSQGFKSGGFNAFRGVNTAFEPESVDAYEIGLKTDLSDTLRMNLAAFRYDYTNLQVRTPVATGGVGIESAAGARSQGIEAEFTATPAEGLRFDANFAYLDAEFTSGVLTAIAQPSWVFGTNPATVQENITGHRMTRAPEFQGSLSGKYEWSIGEHTASVQATVRHQGKVFFLETQQQASTFQGSGWTEVDARIALAAPGDRWELALFGKNLFDDRHFSQITAFFGLPNGALNDPQRVGIQLSARY